MTRLGSCDLHEQRSGYRQNRIARNRTGRRKDYEPDS